ncbi:phage tail terminator protein [Xanthomonas citri]|uniref:phage tail terminator protein n=1 Tax=Xanthomonas citri TaxID=346 RepID=UPI0001CED3D4|nr:hypothetical protein [Xanthomonas citri]AMU97903.1 hypothetical protein TP37_07150 [Xanthomonas citri pv. aurantifolii]EFF46349.1 hypothetical protein XAUC_33360 [Xanthomonas citri pv. aurantifolii str. ICPB 10535]MCC8490000.1 hypothetical protein [Xanthomonas citri pv. fuscans]TBW96810.1 hypothetical protein TP47_13335 [Xanthomonas citri pv. aurantifolii]TBX05029.1 hypothetical protein TP46_01685 [Xanthomonas citri pv. aurantifolii]
MSSIPFDVAPVIERVAAQVSVLQQVRGAADYAAIQALRDFRTPEAFVLVTNERAASQDNARISTGASAGAGQARQAAAVEIGVVLAVRNYRYERGKPAVNDAMPIIGSVRDSLMGWLPPNVRGARPLRWLRGYVLDYDAGTLLWADTFTTQHFIGKTP